MDDRELIAGTAGRAGRCKLHVLAALFFIFLAGCASHQQAQTVNQPSPDPAPTTFGSEKAGTSPPEQADVPVPTVVNDPSGAVITIYDFGPMVLHAFVNPPEGFGTATYIIEGANNLVLIDSHYSAAPAHAFREYADSLGKPLARIYVTHEHPDHINGLRDAFADVESYAGPETARLVGGSGIEIDHIVASGSEVFDGLTYQFELYSGAESAESLLIMLPEYGIVATGDLVYNQYHMVLNRHLDPWIEVLEALQQTGDHALILPGHGQPDTPEVYAENLDYLRAAARFYGQMGEQNAFTAAMAEMFPDHSVLAFLRLGAGRMYPKN